MKFKKKDMNKIHNEMVRRFDPYWRRKNADIRQLQNAVIELQNAVKVLQGEQVQMAVQEASAGDTGKHVAEPKIPLAPKEPEVWEATFSAYGGAAVSTIPALHTFMLKKIHIEFITRGSSVPSHVRVQLLTTRFPGKVDALQAQLTRIMQAPVKAIWRKIK